MKLFKYLKHLISVILVLASFSNVLIAQDDDIVPFGEDSVYQEYYLGFNIKTNMSGGLVNFALIKPLPNGKRKIILLTQDAFMYQAVGKQKSLGNPQKINLFEKYQIKNPNIVSSLWKLRYTENPNQQLGDYLGHTYNKANLGWSQNDSIPFLPTNAQMIILREFGIDRFSDYIYDEKAFRLLNAMEDPEWVKAYKESY